MDERVVETDRRGESPAGFRERLLGSVAPVDAPVPGGGFVRYLPGLGLQVWLLLEFLSVIGRTTQRTSAWEIVIGLVMLAVVVITPIRDRRKLLRSLGINALAATAIAMAKVALYVDPHEEMEPTKTLVAQASLISAAESWALVALILVSVYSAQVRWRTQTERHVQE